MAGIRVLLVDDDPMVLQINRDYVSQVEGFQVAGMARSGTEALQAVVRSQPDLVLLDVFMPDQDGLAMLRELRSQGLPTDVILVSAAQDAATVQEVLRMGAVDYIIKPFRFERLRSALQAYRTARQRLQANATFSQEQLDQVLRPPSVVTDESLPKGLNESTMQQVVEYLARAVDACTAAEVSQALGIARVTARRYLDHLEKLGKVSVCMQYGGVGRPLNRYLMRG